LLFVFLLAAWVFAGCEIPPPPFVLEKTREVVVPKESRQAIIAYNPNGADCDLVALAISDPPTLGSNWESRILVADTGRGLISQLNLSQPISQIAAADVSGDGLEDLLVFFDEDTMAGVHVYKWPELHRTASFSISPKDFHNRGTRKWDARLGFMDKSELGNTSASCVWLSIHSPHGWAPRGVMMVDLRQSQMLWYYETACKTETHVTEDVDGDGQLDLIIGSYGANNGAVWQDRSDDNGYVEAISHAGQSLWSIRRDREFSGFMVSAIKQTIPVDKRIFALSYTNWAAGGPNRLLTIRANDGHIQHEIVLSNPVYENSIFAWNPKPDGLEQCLFSMRDSTVGLFSEQGQLFYTKVRLDGAIMTDDLNRDGRKELVGAYKDKLKVYDAELKLIAVSREAINSNKPTVQHQGSRWPILWTSGADGIYRIVFKPNPIYPDFRRKQVTQAILSVSGSVAFVIGLWFAGRWVIRVRHAMHRARVEREQTRAMVAVVRTIGHDMQYPLSVLSHATHGLKHLVESRTLSQNEEYDEYFRDFRDAGETLADASLRLRKYVGLVPLRLETLRMSDLIHEVLSDRSLDPVIRIETKIETNFPLIQGDRKQMKSVIQNLVKNSFKAMKNGGTLQVRAKSEIRAGVQMVRVEVQDSGCGIATGDLPHVFDPDFSRFEEGTGLGLAIVKKTITDHEGSISISSTLGIGTTIVILLPTEKEEA
jgi:signal transduction histidine kinase